jgi:hypothetical protein
MTEEQEIINDGCTWYAIQLFTTRQEDVATYFSSHSMESYIPMQYQDMEDENGKLHHVLRPVVHNLLFVKKTISDNDMCKLVNDSNFKIRVMRKVDDANEYYEIPAKQMYEFRLMCNPEISMRKFLATEEAKLKAGAKVFVKYGPLKGLTGRLVRSNKKYYLLKEVPGISVMLKVTRWCCVPSVD